MKELVETKAIIVTGKSKSGNTYYGLKIWLTKDYATLVLLQNGDRELVREKYDNNPNLEDNQNV